MLEQRLNEQAWRVVALAEAEARERNFSHVGTESLLVGLLRDQNCWASALLGRYGVTLDRARAQVATRVAAGPPEQVSEPLPFTPRMEQVLARANQESLDHNDGDVGTEHILFGLVDVGEREGMHALRALGLSAGAIRDGVVARLFEQRGQRHPR